MSKIISVLGSTGSIGVQTLDVARNLDIRIASLVAGSNIELLEKQAREFNPKVVAVKNEENAKRLKESLKDTDIEVLSGDAGICDAICLDEVQTVVTSVVGIAGLIPTMKAIKKGKNIALANKETLVTAGSLIMEEAKKRGVSILPVDSEHSAIFQCLMGNSEKSVKKLILSASGGPFRGRKIEDLEKVKVSDALKHPNWVMGQKITIDSATLMNKGLEVIEARWLFGMEAPKIQVVVHPQSIIHSLVEYVDGSVMAQLGSPDMRIPIQFALTYPNRYPNNFSKLDLLTAGNLTFEEPDMKTFKCLQLALDALDVGGTMPVVLNAANEIAVQLFLEEKISFLEIANSINKMMDEHNVIFNPTLEEIISVDNEVRVKMLS